MEENKELESFELVLTDDQLKEIKETAEKLKKSKKIKKVFPMAVGGDEDDDKDLYVAYFKEPSLKDFSKFQVMGKSQEAMALRQLAKDCFLAGDEELITDDSLFMGGLMSQILGIVRFRKSSIVNLSKAGK